MARLICGIFLLLLASGVAAKERPRERERDRYESPYSNKAVRRVRAEERAAEAIERKHRSTYFRFKPLDRKKTDD